MDQLNLTVATSNFSSPGLLPHPNWYSSRLVPALMCCLCCIVGVPGNIAVIILRPNWQHLSSLSQSLLMNLAVSDLICLLTLPIWIYSFLYSWTFSLVFCKLLAYIVYCTLYGSLLTVTGLSVQRYLLVVRRQNCHQVRKRLLLVLLWLTAFILSIPALVIHQLVTDHQWLDCRAQYSSDAQWLVALLTETVFGSISFVIVALSYVRVKKKISQAAFFNNPQTTRLITSIIISLFVLWVPYHALNVLGMVAIGLKNESLVKFYTDTWNIVAAVTFINSCLNPLLYAFTSRKICNVCQMRKETQQMESLTRTADISTTAELSQ